MRNLSALTAMFLFVYFSLRGARPWYYFILLRKAFFLLVKLPSIKVVRQLTNIYTRTIPAVTVVMQPRNTTVQNENNGQTCTKAKGPVQPQGMGFASTFLNKLPFCGTILSKHW